MPLLLQTTQTALDYLQSCLTSTNLQIVLLIGSGILAVGLLMLALTRWGHSKPVYKCVILSVIAHVLLIAYAWGTHLIAPAPVEIAVQSEPMRINFEEETGADAIEVQPEHQTNPVEDWDQFSAESPSSDDLALPREEIQSEMAIIPTDTVAEPLKLEPNQERVEKPAMVAPVLTGKSASVDAFVEELTKTTQGEFKPSSLMPVPEIKTEPIEVARRGNFTPPSLPQPNPQPFTAEANTLDRPDIVAIDSGEFQLQPKSQGRFEKPDFESFSPAAIPDSIEIERSVSTEGRSAPLNSNQRQRSPLRNVSADYSTPRRLSDGQPLPEIYALRNAPNRAEIAKQRGGSRETERAVELALAWLAENQSKDGRWNPRLLEGGRADKVYGHDREGAGTHSDTGITSLAVLAFLANGYSHIEGPYQDVVKNGLEYLVSNQASDGELAGGAKLFARMYCHSMSLLAISEAYAMTGDRRLAVAVQRGVNYSVDAQDTRDGGWRYQPGDEGDMSQFGWQVLALHSAELAGIDIPKSTSRRMVKFLNRCCISPAKGIAAYRPGQGPNTTMTAEALVCRHLLKQPVDGQLRREATDRILSQPPNDRRVNMYYWYYGTMAMYLSGGKEWDQWNQQMKATLLESQVTEGSNEGSWEPNGLWAGYGGRAYSTAMAALTLEVYYRYLRVYEVADQNGDRPLR
jgi:hypothetical protein